MSDADPSRDATATIQGYIFQFDATILSLCNLTGTVTLDIEVIEDFDIATSDVTELFQCKYYEATRLTPATIRDAILPMLKGFLNLPPQDRSRRRFHLYGYFKDSTPGDQSLDLSDVKSALTRREAVNKGTTTQFVTHDIQKELGATDDELKAFASQLTIHITSRVDDHRRETIESLKRSCSVSAVEAELFVYPTARTLISTMACSADPTKRRLSRAEFIARISPTRALFNHWSLREHGEAEYCSRIRREYFSQRNIDAISRVFIVDAMLSPSDADLLSLCHALRRKWSSHGVRRRPDSERYAPILYIRDLSQERLVTLKTSLHHDAARFVDGYPFLGATFAVDHLLSPQTYVNQLSLRLVNSRDELSAVLALLRGERIAYDFYLTSPSDTLPNCKWVSLPVTSARSIESII